MNQKDSILDKLEGTSPLDSKVMEGFKKEMDEDVIPQIVKVVEERQMLAHESRHRRIEVLAPPKKTLS